MPAKSRVDGGDRFGSVPARPCGVLARASMLAVLLWAGQASWGIVTSDDPNGTQHLVAPDSAYNMVGYLDRLGGTSGVLIGPRHVLTAKHVVEYADPTTITFRLDLPDGPHVYHVAQRFMHDTADIAMLILAEPTDLVGYGLYANTDEGTQNCAIVGYGEFGTGLTGGHGPRGTSRIAWNIIDRTYHPTPSYDGVLGFDFDRFDGTPDGPWGGDSIGESLEGSLGVGDSGGGLFIDVNEVPLLAGIHSEVISYIPGKVGYYGDAALSVRISHYVDWIRSQVRGDANWDGRVDGADYTIWADHYGQTGVPAWSSGGWSVGNFNEDATVDGADYTLWADNYLFGTGGDAPMGRSALLPEPGTILLLGMGCLPLLRRRRQPGTATLRFRRIGRPH